MVVLMVLKISQQADQLGEKVAEFSVSMATKLRGLFLVDDLSESLKVGCNY